MSSNVHLKGLNGIRAIAAMAVVVFHIGGALKDFGFAFTWTSYLGGHGVTMFFSLSGFLITYLLLIEKTRVGRIDIKAFYIRRILRIWPVYYFYLLLAAITIYFFMPAELTGGIFYYIALCANIPFIFGFPLSFLAHYWSLGVEEQFYLFWPWVVRRSKNLLRFLLIFIFIFVVTKLGLRYLDATSSWHWPYQLIHVIRFDCMAIGAAGAVLFFKKNVFFLKISFSAIAQLVAWGSIVLSALSIFHLASVIDSEIIAVVTVILIVNVSSNPRSLVNLEKPFFDFLGKISYGIYVYHPLIIFLAFKSVGGILNHFNDSVKLVLIFALIIVVNVLVAYISYEFFEKRFLSLKVKFSPVKSVDSIKDNA
jgi:peptidoglycan/LPS O-acetylase OafA/YrhL